MGALSSKSPAERRNTVLRRSQRKSVHSVKSKTDKLLKDIKKFKGVEEDTAYIELKSRIEALERDLNLTAKNLQPQIRPVYNDTLKKTVELFQLLDVKLAENKSKVQEVQPEEQKEEINEDDVFIEETNEELGEGHRNLEETTDKRKTVELKVIQVQVESLDASPMVSKRQSIIKVGVPVMPGAIMEDLNRKTQHFGPEEKIAGIRKKIEEIELEISQFIGKKNGRYYNKIKEQLEEFEEELRMVPAMDEVIAEQIKLCNNYIGSCMSFLNEKGTEDEEDTDEEEENANEGPPPGALNGTGLCYPPPGAFSPRTTYI